MELVKFKDEEGNVVIIETSNEYKSGGKANVSISSKIKEANDTLNESLGTIRTIAKSVVKTTKDLVEPPKKIEIKLGIKFSAEAGAVIAKASSEGNIEVTIIWESK